MIQVEHVSKQFGSFKALDDVNFKINQGEVVGFLGQNGAGKTTLMRLLTGYYKLTHGNITINDMNMRHDAHKIKQRIGYLPENPPLYLSMTVSDYLNYSAQIKGVKKNQMSGALESVLQDCHLKEVANKSIGVLSKGFKQRVGIAQAIIHDPSVLILDEPTSGLDPIQVIQVRDLIKNVEKKRTVILSTHILSEIEHVASRVLVIKKGCIISDGTVDELKEMFQTNHLEEAFLKLNTMA